MAESTVREQSVAPNKPTASNKRRYVGSKETAAYVIYDISQSFNINKYADVFITDVVQIRLL